MKIKDEIEFYPIVNHNTGTVMCEHQTCSQKPTHFACIEINGVPFHVVACQYHAYEATKQYGGTYTTDPSRFGKLPKQKQVKAK